LPDGGVSPRREGFTPPSVLRTATSPCREGSSLFRSRIADGTGRRPPRNQILIAPLCLKRRPPPRRQSLDPDHPNPLFHRKRQHIPNPHRTMRTIDRPSIDAKMPLLSNRLRGTPRFREPHEPQEPIDPHRAFNHGGPVQRVRQTRSAAKDRSASAPRHVPAVDRARPSAECPPPAP